jgi:hypothetical protein
MEIVIIIAVAVVAICAAVVTYQLVKTLEQVRLTAQAAEKLSLDLDREVEKIQTITDAASQVAGLMGGTFGKSLSAAASFLRGLWSSRRAAARDDDDRSDRAGDE